MAREIEKETLHPKNKELFERLVPFAKRIIEVCRNNKIEPVIYGSYAHFYYTKDKKMNVNDIDLLIPKNSFNKIISVLKKEKIQFEYVKEFNEDLMSTIIITKEDLKVELDETGTEYNLLKEKDLLKKRFEKIYFYGIKIGIISLKQLEDVYTIAYNRSTDSKPKILKKIKHLNKFNEKRIK